MEGFRQFIWDSDAWTTGPYCSQDVGYLLTQRGSQTLLAVGVSSFCRGCWLSTDTITVASVHVGRPLQCILTVTTLVTPSAPGGGWLGSYYETFTLGVHVHTWAFRPTRFQWLLSPSLTCQEMFLCISFLVYKMKIITVQTPRGC